MSDVLVGIDQEPVDVPPVVHTLAKRLREKASVVPAWRNAYGGFTVLLEEKPTEGGARSTPHNAYLKWVPHGTPCATPLDEVDRLAWAGPYTALPHVLDSGRDAHGSWMLTAPFLTDGRVATSAIEPRWRRRAAQSAIEIGIGLRRFHDALPTKACPFDWTAESRVTSLATNRPVDRLGGQTHRTTAEALIMGAPPPVERLVVCHGDATVPNTLLDHLGRFAAHIDIGDLGMADRWSDIAVTTRSVTRRYGPHLEPLVLAAYGVGPDHERTRYYRALWDAEEGLRIRRAANPVTRVDPKETRPSLP